MLPIDPTHSRTVAVGRAFQEQYGPCRSRQYEMIASGELQAIRIGRRNYIRREDAEHWLRNRPARPVAGRAA